MFKGSPQGSRIFSKVQGIVPRFYDFSHDSRNFQCLNPHTILLCLGCIPGFGFDSVCLGLTCGFGLNLIELGLIRCVMV